MVLIFGWSFWAWVEERRERRRQRLGGPVPTSDPTGWRTELGLPLGQAPEEIARLQELEADSYKAIHERARRKSSGELP